MKALPTDIPDVIVLEPKVFEDQRGFFMESFNHRTFQDVTGETATFVQDNHSQSRDGVLRGLHYQVAPRPQGKLVRVIKGTIFDVAVDLRPSSPTFTQWVSVVLSAQNRRQLWIPVGFAHGFLTLSDHTEVLYKTTEYYSADDERSIAWDDPDLAIRWPLSSEPLLSPKDANAPPLAKADIFN